METYLLDTNVISYITSPKSSLHQQCARNFEKVSKKGSRVLLPVIAIAEIEYGLQLTDPQSNDAKNIRAFLYQYKPSLNFDDKTVEPYAALRAELFSKYGTPKDKRKRKKFREKLPEELVDVETGKSLGIDERDLMIASIAVQYNCVLAAKRQ